jgi:hypothetical protein
MPIRSVPNSDLRYYLVAFDKKGNERPDPDAGGGNLSAEIKKALADGTTTDVFVLSHGWMGDMPAAVDQYDSWISAMAACARDRDRARQRWPNFKSLIVGFHWSSKPWGDESMDGSFAAESNGGGGEQAFVDAWADRIADTPAAREALQVIFESALDDPEPDRLTPEVVAAYKTLEKEAELGAEGVGGAPDADREPLDPQVTYQEALAEDAAFGGGIGDGILSPLRQLSFWTMKKRARSVGESGGHELLRLIKAANPNGRLHLMGHSFGCIVVSSMMLGRDGSGSVPIASALLVQGAMSLWSYCEDIPEKRGTAGYFRPVVSKGVVSGPIVVTTSRFDSAVGTWYPRAAAPSRQVDFDVTAQKLPKYGAIGTFGLNGPGLVLEQGEISEDVNFDYNLAAGRIYNLRGDRVIKTGGGFSGAHSDIAHPQVGHAFWEAVLATPGA